MTCAANVAFTFTLYAYWLTFTSRGGEDGVGVITANKAAKSQVTALDIFKDTWGYFLDVFVAFKETLLRRHFHLCLW